MYKHTAAKMAKSGQIRDTKPKTEHGRPGKTNYFPDTSLKIRTVPKNVGRMVTLIYTRPSLLAGMPN